MRKFLKIFIVIVTVAYFYKWFLPFYINEETNNLLSIIYLILLVPYIIYDLTKVIKDDRINKTNVFRKRIILVITAILFLILTAVLLNFVYKI